MDQENRERQRADGGDDEWDEIGYVYDKILYWFYQRADTAKTRPYAERLERLLAEADPGQEAIFGAECRSLIHEIEGDLPKAIAQRREEISLIRPLHEIAGESLQRDVALQGYDYQDLSDRLDLLATLYQEKGDVEKAIATLRESKRLCKIHGLPFDGADILAECLAEKAKGEKGATPRRTVVAPSVTHRKPRNANR